MEYFIEVIQSQVRPEIIMICFRFARILRDRMIMVGEIRDRETAPWRSRCFNWSIELPLCILIMPGLFAADR